MDLWWVCAEGFLEYILAISANVFDGDPAHYREPAQFRNAVI